MFETDIEHYVELRYDSREEAEEEAAGIRFYTDVMADFFGIK